MPFASGQARRLTYLDGLRAVTAIYVVLCHAFLQVNFRPHPPGMAVRYCLQLLFYGHYAVAMFIVLSGFCLMLPVVSEDGALRGGAGRFLLRRARRIIPPYYAAIGFSLGLIWLLIGQKTGTHWDISIPVSGWSVFTHLIFLQDALGEEASINHVFWSIAAEWRIYFLFPVLVWSWRRAGALLTVATALVLSIALFKAFLLYLGNSLAAHYLGLFAMGMLGADVAFSARLAFVRRWPWGWITGGFTGMLALMFYPQVWHGPAIRVYVGDYLAGAWSTSLLIMTACNEGSWVRKALAAKPLVFVGTFAYSLYLIHAPLLQVLWQYAFVPLQDRPLAMLGALIFVGGPLIVGVSYGFFLVFERPFLSRRNPETAAVLSPAP